jgi:hypothetical protein
MSVVRWCVLPVEQRSNVLVHCSRPVNTALCNVTCVACVRRAMESVGADAQVNKKVSATEACDSIT